MARTSSTPALAARILATVLPEFSRQAILGDMQETFAQLELEQGRAIAVRWFWRETLAALPLFALHFLQTTRSRRQMVNGNIWNENWFGKQDSRLVAGISFVILLPALLLVGLAMVWFTFGETTFNLIPGAALLMELMETGYMQIGNLSFPIGIVILGSLFLTLLIILLAAMKINIERVKDSVRFTITVKPKTWNVILLVLVVLLGLGLDWLIS